MYIIYNMSGENGYVEDDTNFNFTPLFGVNQGNLSIGVPIENSSLVTFGDINMITPLPNPNLNNELVFPAVQVGGSLMANDIILGSNNTTKFISDNTGTFIYSNLYVSGDINNNNLTTALNSKATSAQLSTLNARVDDKADYTDLITNYYNKNQTDSLLLGKANNNNVYSISQIDTALSQKANTTDLNNKVNASDVYTKVEADVKYQTKTDMDNYPTFDNIADLDTTIASLSNVYQSIANMSTYVTTGTLINNYATQLELSTKVEQTYFENQVEVARQNAINNSYSYTNNEINNLSTIYQPISSMSDYITSGSLTSYQTIANMATYITSGSLTEYQAKVDMGSYITSGSLTAYQPIANMATYVTSGSLTAYQPIANMVNYQPKFWVAFEYLNTPAVNSFGQVNITTGSVTSSQAGNYLITMPAHPSGSNYGIMVVSRAAGIAYANYSGSKSSTQFRVYTYNSSGVLANSDYTVHTIP